MSEAMRVGSLFSGAGGFDLGFHAAGFETAWFCEIDPTARAVLARHWPEVPCYEDITKLDPATLPRVDVLIGGFPCQDVSVAGNRAGLAGKRTGLFWEMARLIEGLCPTWLVLENVPGLLSSDGPNDMGTVLWALGERGYGWAYRVLDAQHWGVPQRRRRVFIVGHFGADTARAAQVLFESDRSAGDSPAGGEAGEGVTRGATASAGESGGVYCIKGAAIGRKPDSGPQYGEILRDACYTLNATEVHAIAATLRSRNHAPGVNAPGRGGEDDQNLVVEAQCFESRFARNGRGAPSEIVPPLKAQSGGSGKGDGAPLVLANTVQASAGHHGHSSPRGDGGDNLVVAHCLNGSQERLDGPVETFVCSLAENQRGELRTSEVSPALGGGGGKPGSGESATWNGSTVRRLMPVETERLQGWPDGWTSAASGQWLKDGPRYRLVGNGVAAPVARWIAERILAAEADPVPRRDGR